MVSDEARKGGAEAGSAGMWTVGKDGDGEVSVPDAREGMAGEVLAGSERVSRRGWDVRWDNKGAWNGNLERRWRRNEERRSLLCGKASNLIQS